MPGPLSWTTTTKRPSPLVSSASFTLASRPRSWTSIRSSGTMPAFSQASSELSTASLIVVRSAFEGLSNPSRWRFLTKNSETEISRCFWASDSAVALGAGRAGWGWASGGFASAFAGGFAWVLEAGFGGGFVSRLACPGVPDAFDAPDGLGGGSSNSASCERDDERPGFTAVFFATDDFAKSSPSFRSATAPRKTRSLASSSHDEGRSGQVRSEAASPGRVAGRASPPLVGPGRELPDGLLHRIEGSPGRLAGLQVVRVGRVPGLRRIEDAGVHGQRPVRPEVRLGTEQVGEE